MGGLRRWSKSVFGYVPGKVVEAGAWVAKLIGKDAVFVF